MDLYLTSATLSCDDRSTIDQPTQNIREKMTSLAAIQKVGVNPFFKNEDGKVVVRSDSDGITQKMCTTVRHNKDKVMGLNVVCSAMIAFLKK